MNMNWMQISLILLLLTLCCVVIFIISKWQIADILLIRFGKKYKNIIDAEIDKWKTYLESQVTVQIFLNEIRKLDCNVDKNDYSTEYQKNVCENNTTTDAATQYVEVHLGTNLYRIPKPLYATEEDETLIETDLVDWHNNLKLYTNGTVCRTDTNEKYTYEDAFMVRANDSYGVIACTHRVIYWDFKTGKKQIKEFTGNVTWVEPIAERLYQVICDGEIHFVINNIPHATITSNGLYLIKKTDDILLYSTGFVHNGVVYNLGRCPQKVVIYSDLCIVLMDGELFGLIFDKEKKQFGYKAIPGEDIIDIKVVDGFLLALDKEGLLGFTIN